jgi:hypothetical protein
MGECLAKAGSRAAPPGSSDDRHQTIRGGTDARNLRSWRAAGPAGPLSRGTSEARAQDYGTVSARIHSPSLVRLPGSSSRQRDWLPGHKERSSPT